MAQAIQRQLEEIEVKHKELENHGVTLEKALRGEDTNVHGRDESALMQEWFQLVHEKNALSRYEQELMVSARELELEDRHARLQLELKDSMSLDDWNGEVYSARGSLEPETVKSAADVHKEGAILTEMLEIVEQKDSLRSMLEEDRQRWAEFLNLIDWASDELDGTLPHQAEPVQRRLLSIFYSAQLVQQSDQVELSAEEEEFEEIFPSNRAPRKKSLKRYSQLSSAAAANSIPTRRPPPLPTRSIWTNSSAIKTCSSGGILSTAIHHRSMMKPTTTTTTTPMSSVK